MNKLRCNIIFLIVTFMLFTDSFFCLLTDKLKNWLIRSILHVYFNLRQCLVVLKGLFGYLNNPLYSLYNRIKNRTLPFSDPRVRDPHSIIANILILLASMPAFIFLFSTMFSYKVIFIPILQIIVYIRRALVAARLLKFIGSFLRRLNFRNFLVMEVAMIPFRALGTVKGVDFYLTQMSRPERREFMRAYRKEYLNNIPELTALDKRIILDQTDSYILRGLAGHSNISAVVRGSSVSDYPLAVHTALTTKPLPYPREMAAVLNNAIISIKPELREQLETVKNSCR